MARAFVDALAPTLVDTAIAVVHASAGKHICAAHERGPLVAPNHEDLRRGWAVAQHDHRRRRARGSRSGREFAHPAIMDRVDTNGLIASLLRDLATVQSSRQSQWGYKRAAAAIRNLDEPIESLVQPDGTLRKIAHIGPSSARVILEVLRTGRSETVERAIAASGRGSDVAKSRDLRGNFLTRAQVVAALRNTKLRGPQLSEYRGDLQMHSTWSDGSQTLEDIVEGGIARAYQYCAVTDHSYGLPIAGGISMTKAAEQHRHIESLNRTRRDFRLLKGIEANIRADGSVDMEPDELREFEIVVAAPHSALRSTADQTARMQRAVSTAGVSIL